ADARDHDKEIPETSGGERTSQGPGVCDWHSCQPGDCRRRCWRTVGVEPEVSGVMALHEGIEGDEATHHDESEHRVGQTPAVAIDQILSTWHQHQCAYAGAAEHQAGSETTALAEPQCHLRQV